MKTLLKNILRVGLRDALWWHKLSDDLINHYEVQMKIRYFTLSMSDSMCHFNPIRCRQARKIRDRLYHISRKIS